MRGRVWIALVISALVGGVAPGVTAPANAESNDDVTTTAKPAGTIVGTLQSLWLRRYPMVLYLEEVKGDFEPPEEKPVLDQKNKMFIPHVMAILKGTTIHYVNNDDVKHNVYFIKPDGKTLNLGSGTQDWSRDQTMDQIGVYAHRCNVHDEMSAYIVVLQNPYFTRVDKTPRKKMVEFRLEGVPPGTYNLRVWCEKYYKQENHPFNRAWEVTVEGGEEIQIEVKPRSR